MNTKYKKYITCCSAEELRITSKLVPAKLQHSEGQLKIPWLKLTFPDYSLTFQSKFYSLTIPDIPWFSRNWEPCDNTVLTPVDSARNLGIIFDSHLSFPDQISTLTKSCFFHIRDLRHVPDFHLHFDSRKTLQVYWVHVKITILSIRHYNIINYYYY